MMEQERNLVHSLDELRNDLKGFIETRLGILRAELESGVRKVLRGAMLLGMAAVFAALGLMLLGFCAALAVAVGLGAIANQAGLVWGFLAVGGFGVLLAAGLGAIGRARLKTANLAPRRTLRVLERDQAFLREGGRQYGEATRAQRRA
ncbi:MAG TPA: phage holin family protein [Terracidiphilus sp.]|jgi:uncharacterized membrane protein YqjE|nr:phage holin family protein [Terracidiphilus sp.]